MRASPPVGSYPADAGLLAPHEDRRLAPPETFMRAELPIEIAAEFRGRRLSAAGARVLVEGAVRAGDVLAVVLAGAIVAAWRFQAETMPASVSAALLVGCLLAPNILPLFGLYRAERLGALAFQVPRVLAAWTTIMAALIAVLFAMKLTDEVSRLWILLWFAAGAVALVAARIVTRLALARSGTASAMTRQVAVVGLGEHLVETVARLAEADPALRVAAILDLDGSLLGRWPAGVLALRGFADLERRAGAGGVDQILLALPARASDLLHRTMRNLRHLTVDVSWVPELPGGRIPVLGTAQVADVPMVRLLERPLDGWRYALKTIEDRVLAAFLLVLVAPVLALIAVAVKLDTPGPVFYRQRRHGFSREPIAMLKFRTMHTALCDPIDARSVRQATRDDPRITRVGRILRRTSLDELPQLWNVLMGDMSLVGPRPHAVAHDQHYGDLIDDYLGRHRVKPGITGWAQVHGFRGETRTLDEMRRRIELDLEYIDNWSLWLDLRILLRTAVVGFAGTQAY